MSRIKAPKLATRAEFEDAVNKIAALEVKSRKFAATRDARIQAVQNEFKPAETALAQEISRLVVLAEKFAEEHRDELFPKDAKSAETPLARFGFRYGNPTLSLLNRRYTWEAVKQSLKSIGLGHHVRTVEEVDKDGIKNAKFSEATLQQIGVKITQAETFFIEPKLDGAEPVKS